MRERQVRNFTRGFPAGGWRPVPGSEMGDGGRYVKGGGEATGSYCAKVIKP